jgi:hypothetical protein
MLKKITIFSMLLFCFALPIQAQSVGINTTTPHASAALDVTATDKGVLIPRVALASAITSAAEGLMVYQNTAPKGFYYYNGTVWTLIGSDNLGNHTATQNIAMGSNSITGANNITATGTATLGGNAYPTTTGTNGQVLTTNGAGTLSWQTPSSGGTNEAVRVVEYNCTSPCPDFFITLTAADHTVILTGVWGNNVGLWWDLPNASTCSGRKYKLILRSRSAGSINPPCVYPYDNANNFVRGKNILDNDKPTTSTAEADHDQWQCGYNGVKDYTLEIMSNGTQWIQLSYTKNINN